MHLKAIHRIMRLATAAICLASIPGGAALACPSEPFIGSICTMSTNFCPEGFLPADGRALPVNQNAALYSLMGTRFGGDGKTTFQIPNLISADKPNLITCIAAQGIYPPRP
ncbi:phage tail protein [Paramagnetospirillum kuznetsovii]|uniref:Phage tail protein n=1 Tax=Paramagnetospirillum kuznetsovii TaxID=2053833 RepID=A0A364NT92_9PROT|nr:phage tail protein [Paramagnetospirillum kuznetsovii]RAU20288.1 phage tail protein [Paramagnetospirillum kuznetsovii]